MSWGTTIKTKHKSVYIERLNLNSMYDLQEQIEECNKNIDGCFKRLENLAFATPKDIAPRKKSEDGYETPYDFIQDEVRRIREEYDDEIWRLHKLMFAKFILEDYEYCYDEKNAVDLNKDWNKIVSNG